MFLSGRKKTRHVYLHFPILCNLLKECGSGFLASQNYLHKFMTVVNEIALVLKVRHNDANTRLLRQAKCNDTCKLLAMYVAASWLEPLPMYRRVRVTADFPLAT